MSYLTKLLLIIVATLGLNAFVSSQEISKSSTDDSARSISFEVPDSYYPYVYNTYTSINNDDRETLYGDLLTSPPHHKIPYNTGPILWHRHFDDAMYSTVGLSSPAGLAFAGTYLNPPKHVEATPLLGDGTEEWTFAGTRLMVDASRDGEVLAAVDHVESDSTATIMEWQPDSSTPLWSYVVYPCRTLVWQGWASRKPIQVSDDGSTIAVTTNMYTPEGQRGRLNVFEAGNGIPVVEYDLPDPAGNVTATAISSNGEFVAMVAWPNVYVYDCIGQILRWSGPLPSGNDALAISGDGQYLAWGWSTFYLREWTGSSYELLWSHNPGSGYYVGQCALTTDETALAVSWDNGSTYPNEVTLDLYELPSLDLIWQYDYTGSPGGTDPLAGSPIGNPARQHVDIPSQMCFSPDGERLAVASWGGSFPEIHIFDRAAPEPLFTLDTPGSMFDIDIFTTETGKTYVSACGKNVHAGQGGRGGDLYTIRLPVDLMRESTR
jgi:hypothetical protein